jgi:autoinducer 2-degrading protein
LTAITENAAASVRDEAGSLRFNVMEDAQRPTHYFCEIYRDSEALGEYKAAPHFAAWRRAGGRAVPGSQINTLATSSRHDRHRLPAYP